MSIIEEILPILGRGIYRVSAYSTQFCCELKTALRIKCFGASPVAEWLSSRALQQVAQCFVGSNPGCGHGTTHLSHAEAASDMPQLEEPTTKNIQLFTGGLWGEKGKK